MVKGSRLGMLPAAALLALCAALVPLAQADTGTRTDPKGDSPVPKEDITATRVSFDKRITVRTSFVRVRFGTKAFADLDPGRRFKGDTFILSARVHSDRTTSGFMAHGGPSGTGFEKVPCAHLRTDAGFRRDWLKVSVPLRCLQRYARLGHGVWVQIESMNRAGSQDYLPEPPKAFRVPRD